jgi:hypothetical protein
MARYGGSACPDLHALTKRMSHALTPQLMEGLRDYGPHSQGPFGEPLHVRSDVLDDALEAVPAILDAPFERPVEWVLAAVAAAERSALVSDASHLQDVARDQNWFTRQDR